jgi:replicative DNA helicase
MDNTPTSPAPADDVTRSLPYALGPEKSLLSSMLQEPGEWIPAALEEKLTPDHFYLPAHAQLFDTLLEIFDAGGEIELVSLVQYLLDRGKLDRIGGPAALTDLYTYAPSPGHFRHHLRLVRDKFILRSLIRVANETTAAAYDAPDQAAELLDQTEAAIMAIRDNGETGPEGTTRDAVDSVLDEMHQIIRGERETLGISTGFARLDMMTRGLKPGEMFVIAARPSMGKTALMMNIVESVCIEQGMPTMIFSCEMSRHALTQRVLYGRSRISAAAVVKGFNPNKGELQRIQRAGMEIARAPLFIDETEAITISELRAKARRKHRREGLRLIAIDYLQLMKSRTKQAQNSREREIAEISAGIKALAKELGLPIIILAQLNRGPESRTGKNSAPGIPRMSDLRESGAIEQDADLVGLLYRAAYYAETDEAKEAEAGRAELILAKNRSGETGRVPLTFIEAFTQFEEGEPARITPPPTTKKGRFDRLL